MLPAHASFPPLHRRALGPGPFRVQDRPLTRPLYRFLYRRVRDDTLVELGIRLEDKPDGSSVWKQDDPEVLRAEQVGGGAWAAGLGGGEGGRPGGLGVRETVACRCTPGNIFGGVADGADGRQRKVHYHVL